MSQIELPLAGVKVVEFCQVAAGPFCGMLLADFGAEVVKVEPVEGDTLRQWPPMTDGFSENFASLNRGKRSIALDLKSPGDLAVARSLVLDADVLLENNRPGAMDRLGLGWEWFRARKPSLVYCSISAYGQSGPRSGEGGFDLTMQAASGVMSVTGSPDGEPAKCGVPIADFTAGLYAAYSISSALARLRSGATSVQGCHVDVPMFATTLAVGALQTSEYFGTGKNPRRLGSAHPRNAPYQSFRCAGGWFAIAAGNNKLWRAVCEVTGTPGLLADARFLTPTLRAANQTALRDLLEAVFATAGPAEWVQRFAVAGVPSAPINTYADALCDPQTVHLGLVQPMTLPNDAVTRTVSCPIRFDEAPVAVNTRPPALDADGPTLRQSCASGMDAMSKAEAVAAQDPIAPLRAFIVAATELASQTVDEPTRIAAMRPLLAHLIANDGWLPAEAARAHTDRYAQYLLHCDPLERFSVVSFVWGPGQRTPIHDHTVWGLIGMLRGAETAQHYRMAGDNPMVPVGELTRLQPGDVELVSPLTGDIHQVSNAYDDRTSISVHVYGANIGAVARHIFDPLDGTAKPMVSGYTSTMVPNLWDRSASVRRRAEEEAP